MISECSRKATLSIKTHLITTQKLEYQEVITRIIYSLTNLVQIFMLKGISQKYGIVLLKIMLPNLTQNYQSL